MQRQIEKDFISITNASKRDAQKYLKEVNYDLQQAINQFFSADYVQIDALFDQYRGRES
jgi:hypothetical protein